ncbi:MAG: DUF5721 family protein [Defluviitaleaceae bacterium]|nr:DUF5721 family protein [Defluviitaleaceae bacterium]
MISLVVRDTKQFMAKLFKEEAFDNFSVPNMEIVSFATFEISETKNQVTDDSLAADSCTWKTLRPYAFNIIKGKDIPRSIKIVFSLNKEESEKLKSDTTFFMNMYFVDGDLHFTTGTSSKKFTLEKSADHLWEDYVKNFFKKNGIDYQLLE